MCDTKTHISHKQIGQMLIYLGQQQRLGSYEAIYDAKYGIIFFWVKIFHGKSQWYIQQWISKG